jgi:aerobic carbon-monoxide dehydrogenase small subunit
MLISTIVNETPYNADVEPRVLLVDFIRDTLGLTGTKIGCETAQCGTCIVQVDGRSVKSCSILAVQAHGSHVRTIEGVAHNDQLHALQEGFWENHGLQCGFCTPGMIMSLLDLLQHQPAPDEAETRSWLDGSLCRCTGYQSVVRAVQYALQKMQQTESAEAVPVGSAS